MPQVADLYPSRPVVAAEAPADARAEFIRKTYLHLGGAILVFAMVATLLVRSSVAPAMLEWLAGSRWNWLICLGLFMFVGWMAERWAMRATSVRMQYAGLGLYILAQAFLMVPLLFMAAYATDGNVLPTAVLITGVVFGGLTMTVLVTKKDFSFMGRALMIGGFAAGGLILASIVFGFTLGTLFSFGMVVLASGYILYYTSKVLHQYPIGSHVAASLALFSAVALLFWYVLRLVMSLNSD